MYKIIYSLDQYSIQFGNSNIPQDPANSDYQQFIQDVAEQGYDIVEGPDVVEPSYAELRAPEYPPIADQLDKIYHSGVAAWKTQIKEIKDKYPKAITGRTDIGPLPDWLYPEVNNYIYNQQMNAYVEAVERLQQVRLLVGQEKIVSEREAMTGVLETYTVQEYVESLPANDPRVIQDEAERAEAQAVIQSTPQNIIDEINN